MTGYRFANSPYGFVVVTLIIGFALNLMPYFEWMKYAKPDWALLILFYWCLEIPHRIGVGCGWVTGLVVDVLNYSLFGQHAVAKAFVALVAVTASRRIRSYDLWKQCIAVFFVASIDIGITLSIANLATDSEFRLIYWQSALMSALVWPFIYVVLRSFRRRVRVG